MHALVVKLNMIALQSIILAAAKAKSVKSVSTKAEKGSVSTKAEKAPGSVSTKAEKASSMRL